MNTTTELSAFVTGELPALVEQATLDPPTLGGGRTAKVEGHEWRSLNSGARGMAARHHFAVQLRGDPKLLEYWPSDSDDLPPVDDPAWSSSGLDLEPPDDFWTIAYYDLKDDPDLLGLYTYLDLTMEEEGRIAAGTLDINPILAERRERIEPIVKRIADEVRAFNEDEMPGRIRAAIEQKRTELENREAVTASVTFPEAWRLPPLELERADEESAEEAPFADLAIPMSPRLSPSTFENLQRTIRVWADSMERYPRSFGVLSEDQISDLLAATLNATLPGAQREVFTHNGKSDIFVQADAVNEGAGPARVFIIESKKATGETVVAEAIDPQLFGYLTARDTSAVLLLLFDQKDFRSAHERYLAVLRRVVGFIEESKSSVEGWQLLTYEREGQVVRVCVAAVHLPPS